MFEKQLICPVCSCEYVHLTKARTDNGGHDARVNVYMEGDCEYGHSFTITFQQHKGNTFVSAIDTTLPPKIELAVNLQFKDNTSLK